MIEGLFPDLAGMISPHTSVGAILLLAVIVALAECARPARQQAIAQSRRMIANFGLCLISLCMSLALPVSLTAAAAYCGQYGFGLFNMFEVSVWLHVGATVVLASLLGYAAHYAMHRVPVFWRFHAVHHSDREIDFSTAMRHHPCEQICILVMQLPVIILFGAHPGALLCLAALEWVAQILTHANVSLSRRLDRGLGYLVFTPSMHAVHHSCRQPETDSNFGVLFSGWDRLFGTFRQECAGPADDTSLGLNDIAATSAANLAAMLAHPFLSRSVPGGSSSIDGLSAETSHRLKV